MTHHQPDHADPVARLRPLALEADVEQAAQPDAVRALYRHLEQLVEPPLPLALSDQHPVHRHVELDGTAQPGHQLEVDAVGVVVVGRRGAEPAPEVVQSSPCTVVAEPRHQGGGAGQQPGHAQDAVVEDRQLDVVDLAHEQAVHVDDLPVQQVQDGVEGAREPVVLRHVRLPSG